MGQMDLSEKILADYNDVFADIINVLVLKSCASCYVCVILWYREKKEQRLCA